MRPPASRVGTPAPVNCGWPGRGDRGQATVEVALLLPVIVILLAGILWVAQLGSDQISVIDGARAGGRMASVEADPNSSAVREAVAEASGLEPSRLEHRVSVAADLVTVSVSYRSPARIPIIGATMAERTLTAEATFLQENREGRGISEIDPN